MKPTLKAIGGLDCAYSRDIELNTRREIPYRPHDHVLFPIDYIFNCNGVSVWLTTTVANCNIRF